MSTKRVQETAGAHVRIGKLAWNVLQQKKKNVKEYQELDIRDAIFA